MKRRSRSGARSACLPARMLRQLLTEAVVLAVIGGAAGTAVAFWATALLTTNGPAEIPRLSEVSPDARVLGYAIALSLATGVLFGLAPARMLVARPDVAGIGSRRTTSGPGAWRYRASLIAGNVALCVLLLLGSGLLVRSFTRLLAVDAGFTPQQLLTFQVNLIGERYQQNAGITQFFDELTARLAGDARRHERQRLVNAATHGFDGSDDGSDRGPSPRESRGCADGGYLRRPPRLFRRRWASPFSGAAGSNPRTESARHPSSSSARRRQRSCGRARIRLAAAFPSPVDPKESAAHHRRHCRRRQTLRPAHARDEAGLPPACAAAIWAARAS